MFDSGMQRHFTSGHWLRVDRLSFRRMVQFEMHIYLSVSVTYRESVSCLSDVTALAGQRSRGSQTGKWLELLHVYDCGLGTTLC